MDLTEQQTEALATRFDHVALWIASTLDFDNTAAIQSTCDRLDAVCRKLRHDMRIEPDANDARLMLHIVVALQAAIETRVDAPMTERGTQAGCSIGAGLQSLH